jgi:hypothetical protein
MKTRDPRLFVVGLAAAFAGCASFDLSEPIPWKSAKNQEAQTPERMVGIWTDTVLHTAGKPSTRGFGGRVFFYDQRSKAVPVEGTLVVYGFDDSNDASLSREPDRRFVFRPEDLTRNADPESRLGQSYSVWLPWDNVDGVRKQITLVPMFTTKDGQVVAGQHSKLTLPGRDPGPAVADRSPYNHRATAYGGPDVQSGGGSGFYDPAVQRASYAAPAGNPFAQSTQIAGGYHSMDTLSIPMTDSLKQHLLTSPPEQAEFSGPSLRASPPRPAASGNVPGGNHGASLRTTGDAAQAPAVATGTMSPGERYQSEMARIGAVLAEAQAGQQQAANWASNRATPLGPRTSRFARRTPPVPGGGAATPIHGLAHSQPSPGPRLSARPAAPPESPPIALPATASNAGIAPY